MHPYCRAYQQIFRVATRFLNWRTPQILEGYGEMLQLLSKDKTTFVVTDGTITKLGLTKDLFAHLEAAGYPYTVYDKVEPNPTITNVEEALAQYHRENCYTVIAVGGGSPMDCAKLVLTRVAKPKKTVAKLKGVLKVHAKLRPMIAIPTTAGTGSETTVAAVVVDEATMEKYSISDTSLIPTHAAFLPELTVSLPPFITATTGVDALVHAVEAYLGKSNTKGTEEAALQAVKLISENLVTAFQNGADLVARRNMQMASFLAGRAFTRAYVGNVHAMAHALGGRYRTPHGLANAVILPVVLQEYGAVIYPRLARLADEISLTATSATETEKAEAFLAWLRELATTLEIPATLDGIQETDLDFLADRAFHDANPLYPVPVIFSREKFKTLFRTVGGDVRGSH